MDTEGSAATAGTANAVSAAIALLHWAHSTPEVADGFRAFCASQRPSFAEATVESMTNDLAVSEDILRFWVLPNVALVVLFAQAEEVTGG